MRTWLAAICCAGLCLGSLAAEDEHAKFIQNLNHIKQVASTIPSNGDVNPYGVAVVPRTTGALVENDVLVSNFNNSMNQQGTGTTIDEISPNGDVKVFAQIAASSLKSCPGGVGLTTALVVLRAGWVIVGSLPTSDGTSATAQAGCLIVLNRWGQPVETFAGGDIDGPWDMTALDLGNAAVLFVSNVLNGTVAASPNTVHKGTVVRIVLALADDDQGGKPRIIAHSVIASGFPERTDMAALVIGPTGLGLGQDGTLYVADTLGNRIAAIPEALFRNSDAGIGNTVSQGGALNGPLGLAIAPGGDILTVNAGDGNLVETTPGGTQVAVKSIDTSNMGGGTLFGLAISQSGNGVYFVDDGDNTLDLLR
jgi:hypothetical protein